MDEIIEGAIKQNPMTDEKLRSIIGETFEELFVMYGKKNFMRWIDRSKLSMRIKKLVIEEFNEEAKKNHSKWLGYYAFGTNKISLRKIYDKSTMKHEENHLITDKEFLCEFLNEGFTEYLKDLSDERHEPSYITNVKVASFLHKYMGDRIIKAYLKGDEKISFDLNRYFAIDDDSVSTYPIQNVLEALDKAHAVLHGDFKDDDEKNKKLEEYISEKPNVSSPFSVIEDAFLNFITNYIREKNANYEYYKDGKIDIEALEKEISDMTDEVLDILGDLKLKEYLEKQRETKIYELVRDGKNVPKELDNPNYYLEMVKRQIRESVAERCNAIIVNESYLGRNLEPSKVEQLIQMLGPSVMIVEDGYNGEVYSTKNLCDLDELRDFFDENNTEENIPLKNADARIKGEAKDDMIFDLFYLPKFLKEIALIRKRTNCNDYLVLDSIIGNYLLNNLSLELNDKKMINLEPQKVKDIVIKRLDRFISLINYNEKLEKGTIEAKFVKIQDGRYLVKKDDKYVLLSFNDKDELEEYELNEDSVEKDGKVINRAGGVFKTKDLDFKPKDVVTFRTIILPNGKRLSLCFDTNLNRVYAKEDKKDLPIEDINKFGSIDDVMSDIFVSDMLKKVVENIYQGKYTTVKMLEEMPEEEGVDESVFKRESSLDFRGLSNDVYDIIIVTSFAYDKDKDYRKKLYTKLIRSEFDEQIISVNEISILLEYIEKSLSSSKEDKEEETKRVQDIIDLLNKKRNDRVENASKPKIKGYEHLESDKTYTLSEEQKRINEEQKKKVEFVSGVDKYIKEKNEYEAKEDYSFGLDGIYLVSNFNRHTSANDIDWISFCRDLEESIVDFENKEGAINEVVGQSLEDYWGIVIPKKIRYEEIEELEDEKEQLIGKIKERLGKRLLDGESLDLDELQEMTERLSEINRKEDEFAYKYAIYSYSRKEAEENRKKIIEIKGRKDIPEDIKEDYVEKIVESNNSKSLEEENKKLKELLREVLSGNNASTISGVEMALKAIDNIIEESKEENQEDSQEVIKTDIEKEEIDDLKETEKTEDSEEAKEENAELKESEEKEEER